MSPVVVLVGIPGSGKTTVGNSLAQLLGVDFLDTDEVIEAEQGRSIAEIFVDDGEEAFRRLERTAVTESLSEHSGVLSLGGGAILDPQTREQLAGVSTVWLMVSADVAAKRVGLSVARPVLLGNVRGKLVMLSKDRAPLYEEVATMTIDTTEQAPDLVAQAIIAQLESSTAGSS